MSVHQLPDGRWFVRFPKGKIAEKPTATREYFGRGDDAERMAIARNWELGLGIPTPTGGDHDLLEFLQLYQEYGTPKFLESCIKRLRAVRDITDGDEI
jgi:hypothetical protein